MNRSYLFAVTFVTLAAACSGGGTGGNPPVTNETGSVTGTVTASGTGVSGAKVALPGSTTQTTDASGKFTFEKVKVGSNTVSVTLPEGYALGTGESLSKAVNVVAGQAATVNWTLSRVAPAQTVNVDLQAISFSPKEVTVSKGSTIHWVNRTATAHTITPDDAGKAGTWKAQNISGTGTEFSHTFDTVGAYEYHCVIHAGMTGTITVQ